MMQYVEFLRTSCQWISWSFNYYIIIYNGKFWLHTGMFYLHTLDVAIVWNPKYSIKREYNKSSEGSGNNHMGLVPR